MRKNKYKTFHFGAENNIATKQNKAFRQSQRELQLEQWAYNFAPSYF